MALLDDIHRAQELAQELAQEAQEKAIEAARDAQEILRDAQEKALELARERANEARERARRAAEAMPPGLLVRLASSVVGIPLLLLVVFAEGTPDYAALPFTGAVAVCALLGLLVTLQDVGGKHVAVHEYRRLLAVDLQDGSVQVRVVRVVQSALRVGRRMFAGDDGHAVALFELRHDGLSRVGMGCPSVRHRSGRVNADRKRAAGIT
jgi:hypothetical protein